MPILSRLTFLNNGNKDWLYIFSVSRDFIIFIFGNFDVQCLRIWLNNIECYVEIYLACLRRWWKWILMESMMCLVPWDLINCLEKWAMRHDDESGWYTIYEKALRVETDAFIWLRWYIVSSYSTASLIKDNILNGMNKTKRYNFNNFICFALHRSRAQIINRLIILIESLNWMYQISNTVTISISAYINLCQLEPIFWIH